MSTSNLINHQAKLLNSINKQLPRRSPAYYTRLLEINSARGLQCFLYINSLLKVIHLEQWIFSWVSDTDQSVPSDLIICSFVNALMALGYPSTAGWWWNDLLSRIMSSSGRSGKPLLLFVEQCDFFLPYCKVQAYRPLSITGKISASFRSSYFDLPFLFFYLFCF